MQHPESSVHVEQDGFRAAREYLVIASRNKWVILGSLALSLTLALMYYLVATKYYQSSTLIVAEGPKGINSVIDRFDSGGRKGDLEDKFDQILFLIQRQIISPDFLGEIAKETGLYADGLDEEGQADALYEVARRTRVERVKMEASAGFSSSTFLEGFVVSYMDRDPKTSMKVTTRIADKFIEDTNKEREKEVEGAGEFLDQELQQMKRELEKKEERISQFKKTHVGGLPSQGEANMRVLDRVETDLVRTNEDLQRHSEKLAMLNQAVQQYRVSGQQSPSLVTSRSMEPDPLFKRLRELREQLVKLRAEFWDGYPEVVLVKEEIRQVEDELVNVYGRDAIRSDKAPLDPYLQDLAKLQSEEKTEISLLQRRLGQLQASRQDLEKRLERSPIVEQELLVLERDYSNLKENYAKLLDKRLHTRVEENIEKRQKGGKFRIVEHAMLPLEPVVPNKAKVLVLGFLFGCVLGGGWRFCESDLRNNFEVQKMWNFFLRVLGCWPPFLIFRPYGRQAVVQIHRRERHCQGFPLV